MSIKSLPQRGPASCPGSSTSVATRDFDVLAGAMQRWNHRFRQLSRGPFEGKLSRLQAGGVQILRIASNQKIHAQGTLPADTYTCVPIRPRNEGAIWDGRKLSAGQTRVLDPTQVMDHMTAASDYESVLLIVEGELARRSAPILGGFPIEERLAGTHSLDTNPVSCRSLWSHLVQLLDLGKARPDLLSDPHSARLIEQECVRLFVKTLDRTNGDAVRLSMTRRKSLVRRAEELVRASPSEPVSILDLCRELDVSERTLHYAFQEVRDESPMACIKAHRLNAVRVALKAALPGTTVQDVARRWGFWHTGEFAADYHKMFAEMPSETLGRSR